MLGVIKKNFNSHFFNRQKQKIFSFLHGHQNYFTPNNKMIYLNATKNESTGENKNCKTELKQQNTQQLRGCHTSGCLFLSELKDDLPKKYSNDRKKNP